MASELDPVVPDVVEPVDPPMHWARASADNATTYTADNRNEPTRRITNDMTVDRRADPLLMQQEHVPVLAHRPAALKVAGDRLPDLARERQQRAVAGLARADLHGPRPPVNVPQLEPSDLAGSQPQTSRQQQHRTGSQPRRRVALSKRDDQARELTRTEIPRHS